MKTIREKELDQMVDVLNQELSDVLLAKAEADAVINDFNDYDTLVDENRKMAKFIESQGFNVEDVIFFNGCLDRL